MSEVYVGGRSPEMATLLLAAAEELGLDPGAVRSTSKGYWVPAEVAEAASAGPAEEAPDPGPPARSANKAAWVDHAVSQGLDREEAEAMTKAELIENYKPEGEE